MIEFSAHELVLISDSINVVLSIEFDLPVLKEKPNSPRSFKLRSIESRIDSYLQSIQAGTRGGSVL